MAKSVEYDAVLPPLRVSKVFKEALRRKVRRVGGTLAETQRALLAAWLESEGSPIQSVRAVEGKEAIERGEVFDEGFDFGA